MKISRAEFWAAAATPAAVPQARLPEVALAGRSNVGKSSLLNALTKRRRLARTSRTPGCTRGLVFFTIDDWLCLVDLPGYGYASRSHAERERWKRLVESYLATREELAGVLILIDVRRGPEEEEQELAEFLVANGLALAWVGTKGDKLKRGELATTVRRLRRELAPAPLIVTSAAAGTGLDDVWRWIRTAVAEEPA